LLARLPIERERPKPNAFNRRKPATKPQFRRKETYIATGRERASRRESGEINRRQIRDCSVAECIQSEEACYEAASQSEAKPKMHQEEKQQAEERVKR
jgi:hypothetical protein